MYFGSQSFCVSVLFFSFDRGNSKKSLKERPKVLCLATLAESRLQNYELSLILAKNKKIKNVIHKKFSKKFGNYKLTSYLCTQNGIIVLDFG